MSYSKLVFKIIKITCTHTFPQHLALLQILRSMYSLHYFLWLWKIENDFQCLLWLECHKIHTLNPTLEDDGIRRWGLWSCWGHEDGPSWNGLFSYKIERSFTPHPSPLPSCEDTVRKCRLCTWKRALIWPCWHPDLGLAASRIWQINLCCL